MRTSRNRFTVDRQEGKLLGVCAGIARYTGVDVTVVRIAAVVVTVLGAFPWSLVAYLVAFMVANRRDGASRERGFRPAASLATREETRDRVRSLDLRMQAIETYVTSSNSRLAREIEELR